MIPDFTDQSNQHLNIFALPHQTTLLILLMIIAILATVIGIALSSFVILFSFLLCAVLVLSLRSWLGLPETMVRRYRLTLAQEEEFPLLQQQIDELSGSNGLALAHRPRLMIASKAMMTRVFGSWQRWYILLGRETADVLEGALASAETRPAVRALLLHELHHFKHGDTILVGYLQALLETATKLILWLTGVVILTLMFAALAAPSVLSYSPSAFARDIETMQPGIGLESLVLFLFPSEETWTAWQARSGAEDIALAMRAIGINIIPLLLFSFFSLRYIWRKFLRIQEAYADAAVAHWQGEIDTLLSALLIFPSRDHTDSSSRHPGWDNFPLKWRAPGFWTKFMSVGTTSNVPPAVREQYLSQPIQVFDSPLKLSVLISVYVIALELMIHSTSLLLYSGNYPLHMPMLTTLSLLALCLVIWQVDPRYDRALLPKLALWALSCRIAALIMVIAYLTFGTIFFPSYLQEVLLGSIYALAGVVDSGNAAMDNFSLIELVVQSILNGIIQIVFFYVFTVGFLFLNDRAVARILTWYGMPNAETRLMNIIYFLIILQMLTIAFVILPFVTDLMLLRTPVLFSVVPGIAALIIVALVISSIVWLGRLDRAYAQRCPGCSERTHGLYFLGKSCEQCQTLLHPWLFVSYRTD